MTEEAFNIEVERAEDYEDKELLDLEVVSRAWEVSNGDRHYLALADWEIHGWRAVWKVRFVRGAGEDVSVVKDSLASNAIHRRQSAGHNFHKTELVKEEAEQLLGGLKQRLRDAEYFEEIDEELRG